MLTGVPAAANAASSATPRTNEVIAHNKAQAAQKLLAASTASTTQQHQSHSALHRLEHQTKQLNKANAPPGADGPPLITPSQHVSDDAMEAALTAAEAEAEAKRVAALAQQQNVPQAGVNAANDANANGDPARADHVVPPPPASAVPLPSAFLAMTHTKQHQSDAITLYRSQQQALTDARTHLAEFVTKCGRHAPLITLPLSLRAGYTSVRFIAVEGNAAFYKPMTDGLKKLAEESDKAAYALLLEGKQKYIAHLESLVKTQSFVARAITTYTAFVNSVNAAYVMRGSTTVVPLAAAVTKFETTLRKDIDIFDAQQIEATLKAEAKKQEAVAMEIDAEQKVTDGAHNGNNIAAIAIKATKAELSKAKLQKSLDMANSNIAELQEQVNRLHGARARAGRSVHSGPAAANPRPASTPGTATPKPRSNVDQVKLKRKEPQSERDRGHGNNATSVGSGQDADAMNDEPVPAKPSSSKPAVSSNSRGGGRHQGHPSKKFKKGTGGREGSGEADNRSAGNKAQGKQPTWLDALIRCTGIHDFTTSSIITPFQRRWLANGLRFICTPPKSKLQTFVSDITSATDSTIGWHRFRRSLAARFLFTEDDKAQTRIREKFRLKGRHSHFIDQLEDTHIGDDVGLDFRLIEQYRNITQSLLERAATSEAAALSLSRRYRVNFKPKEMEFMRCLIENPNITCKPADKNLGLVLVDTDWYVDELRRMLSDRVTYSIVPTNPTPTRTIGALQDGLFTELYKLTAKHQETIKSYDADHGELIVNFLLHRITKTGENAAVIPTIYGIIKVHKSKLSMRPIVPCTRSITTPASVVVDELLQKVLRDAKIPWIVKDTKSLIVELEATVLPTQDGDLMTGDIGSLYTNIDTSEGLAAVDEFLTEQNIDPQLHVLIMDLLRFVMSNSYLTFRGTLYLQIDGTAMGTACAPTYANIYVYMKERKVLADFADAIRFYRRFLDDIFAFIAADKVKEFQARMNQLHPRLKFEFQSDPTEAVFLDLQIHKGDRFRDSSVFDLRVHQKSMNLYLYIPWNSFHTDAAKKSFIQTELMRYVRNSSDRADYFKLKRVFCDRLRDRGYPYSFLRPLFNKAVYYADRHYFLYPSDQLMNHPTIFSHPPKSACLLKRIARSERAVIGAESPPVFITSDNPLSRSVPVRSLLSTYWSILTDIKPTLPRPIIAYRTWPSLATMLVYQKAKKNEEARLDKFRQRPSTQPKINAFFIRQSDGRAPPPATDRE